MTTTETSTLPWSFRFVEATRAPLLFVGLGVAVAYLCFFLLINNLAGAMDGLRMEGQPFWLDPWGAIAFTYSLLFGYLIIVVSHLMWFASAHLRDLHPVLTLNSREIAEFDTGEFQGSCRMKWIYAADFSRSGFSLTTSSRSQFRVPRAQRSGFLFRAAA